MTADLEARLLRAAQPTLEARVALLEAAVLGDADAMASLIAARGKMLTLATGVKAKAAEAAARITAARAATFAEHAAMLTLQTDEATTQKASATA